MLTYRNLIFSRAADFLLDVPQWPYDYFPLLLMLHLFTFICLVFTPSTTCLLSLCLSVSSRGRCGNQSLVCRSSASLALGSFFLFFFFLNRPRSLPAKMPCACVCVRARKRESVKSLQQRVKAGSPSLHPSGLTAVIFFSPISHFLFVSSATLNRTHTNARRHNNYFSSSCLCGGF